MQTKNVAWEFNELLFVQRVAFSGGQYRLSKLNETVDVDLKFSKTGITENSQKTDGICYELKYTITDYKTSELHLIDLTSMP